MPPLTVTLLHTYTAQHNGRSLLPFRNKKSQALLAYLLVEPPQPHPRETLMTLLWPNSPLSAAQVNLRQALYQLRKAIPNLLQTTRQTVQRQPDYLFALDVADFLTGKTAVSLDKQYAAAQLYRGAFLADFFLPDSAPFEAWTAVWRSQLEQQAQNLYVNLMPQLAARQQQQRLIQLQQRWQTLFPDLETAAFPMSSSPSSPVSPTFCLIDIAGFGRLIDQSEQGAIALLDQYNALMLRCVGRHNGRLLQQMGDGHLLVFEDVSPLPFVQGLLAALAAEPWPMPKPPQLTIALHHAPASEEGQTFSRTGEGYSGTAVLQLHKLFQQAAPNQIVASAAVVTAFPSPAWQRSNRADIFLYRSNKNPAKNNR